jgi:hypothetical protein
MNIFSSSKRSSNISHGFGLIGLLITVCIVAFISVALLKQYSPKSAIQVKDETGQTQEINSKNAIERAQNAKNLIEQQNGQ